MRQPNLLLPCRDLGRSPKFEEGLGWESVRWEPVVVGNVLKTLFIKKANISIVPELEAASLQAREEPGVSGLGALRQLCAPGDIEIQ